VSQPQLKRPDSDGDGIPDVVDGSVDSFGDEPSIEKMLEKEKLVQQNPVEVVIPKITDPNISLELKVDPEAVTEDKLVIPPPVITYKYPFDPVFYTENQLKNRKK